MFAVVIQTNTYCLYKQSIIEHIQYVHLSFNIPWNCSAEKLVARKFYGILELFEGNNISQSRFRLLNLT